MKTLVCVLTYGRSGSSALSKYLVDIGSFGSLMSGPNPDNPKGYWEQKLIVNWNQAYLQGLHNSLEFIAGIKAVITDILNKSEDLAHIKDPRILWLFNYWKPILDNYNTKYIISIRNPRSVIASHQIVAASHGFTSRLDLEDEWNENHKKVLDLLKEQGENCVVVDYDSWIDDTLNQARRIQRVIGYPEEGLEEKVAKYTKTWLTKDLRHFQYEESDNAIYKKLLKYENKT